MKKNYITPAVRCINFDTEDVLLTGSIAKGSDALENENQILSNQREAINIWSEE